jgi:hypothetical protein
MEARQRVKSLGNGEGPRGEMLEQRTPKAVDTKWQTNRVTVSKRSVNGMAQKKFMKASKRLAKNQENQAGWW